MILKEGKGLQGVLMPGAPDAAIRQIHIVLIYLRLQFLSRPE